MSQNSKIFRGFDLEFYILVQIMFKVWVSNYAYLLSYIGSCKTKKMAKKTKVGKKEKYE